MEQKNPEEVDELVVCSGRLFKDIVEFHEKFGLSPVDDPGHKLPRDLTGFRLNFLLEELLEYADAVDFNLCLNEHGFKFIRKYGDSGIHPEKAFDGLIDLVYVALGTAYLHNFPFDEGWSRVHAANMKKVRASGASDSRSTRKHSADIVKPAGWVAPRLDDLLKAGGDDGETK